MLLSTYELDETIEELIGEPIRGNNVNAMFSCPWHDDRTPSLSIRRDDGRFNCFSCGIHGGLTKLARMMGGELNDELKQNILIRSLSTEPARRVNLSPVANSYIEGAQSGPGRRFIRDYLEQRGLPAAVAQHFGLGYDVSRRCMAIPYWDDSVVTGIKLRAEDGSKYSVTDSTYGLYNVDELRGRPVVILGEGESDTHALWARIVHDSRAGGESDSGFSETVSVGGTSGALKSERLWQLFSLDLLFARKVYICYDADDTGDTAFNIAKRYLGDKAIRIRPPTEGDDVTKHFQRGGTLAELGLEEKDLLV